MTRPRPPSWSWPPSSASTPRRAAAPTRAWPRSRSTPPTSSWPPSTTSRSPPAGTRSGGAGQGRPRRRPRPVHHDAHRRRLGADARRPGLDPGREPGDVARRACGSWPSPCATSPGTRPRSWPTRCRSSATCSSSGMVGIIDPLRPSAVEAVRIARAGRHRGPDDHRRPRHHRLSDRRRARPGARGDQRRGDRRDERRGPHRTPCPTCTCSAGSPPRTSSGWPS